MSYFILDENGEREIVRVREFRAHYERHADLFSAFMSIGTGFGVTYKRKCLEHIGLFNRRLRATEDTEMFLRTLSFGYLPLPIAQSLVYVHDHNGSRQTGVELHQQRINECLELEMMYGRYLAHHPNLARQLRFCIHTLEQELADTGVDECVYTNSVTLEEH